MARGGQLTGRAVVFSHDGKHLLVSTGDTTRLYSCRTADRAGQIKGHVSDVTGVALRSDASDQVLTCSTDGSIKIWRVPDCELLQTMNVGYPVEQLVEIPGQAAVLVSLHWREGQAGRIVRCSLDGGKILAGEVLKTTQPGAPLVASPSAAFVATFEKRVLNVWRLSSEHIKPYAFFHTKDFQCVCFDPEDKILAVGDHSGRILLFYNFARYVDAKAAGQELEAPQCTTIHWHSQAVGCLTFTADSTYLLSGGKEGVLVIWHLATGKRTYLPRLGSGLKGIVPCPTDPTLFCIAQEDNTIRLFNLSSMQVIRSIHGVRPPPRGVNALELNSCTRMHPVSRYVVMAGANSSLQFYDPLQDRHVSKLQVIARNNVLQDWQKKATAIIEPRVAHLGFSANGTTMVTIDVRPDPSGSSKSVEGLRFWDEVNAGMHANQAAPYALNTHVDQPHSEGTSAMSYHPLEDTVVTAGRENGFRVWHRPTANETGRKAADAKRSCWKCSCVGSYRRLPFFSSAFSTDGTILALGSSSCVVLWEHPSITLLATLTCPGIVNPKSFFYSVAIPGDSLYVVGATQGCEQPQVVVWNLETLLPIWSQPLYTCGLSPHPTLPVFAVAVPAFQRAGQDGSLPKSLVLVFDVTSSRPKRSVRVPDCLFPWVTFVPQFEADIISEQDGNEVSTGQAGPLLVLSERREIHWACEKGQHIPPLIAPSDSAPAKGPTSKLQALFGDSQAAASTKGDAMDISPSDTKSELDRVAKLLDMPSHLLPPASVLCERALHLMLLPQMDD